MDEMAGPPDLDAARLLMVMMEEELEATRLALRGSPGDARLIDAYTAKVREGAAMLTLIQEIRNRMEQERMPRH